jgi:hypothetical protein
VLRNAVSSTSIGSRLARSLIKSIAVYMMRRAKLFLPRRIMRLMNKLTITLL